MKIDNKVKETFDIKVKQVYDRLKGLGYSRDRILGIFLFGSQNYGLHTEKSDYDFKVIVFPKLDDLLFKRTTSKVYKLNDNDEDQIEVKDIQTMMDMWRKGNPAYLEILETPYFHTNYKGYIESLRELHPASVNNLSTTQAVYGMALQKLKALDHPYPSKIKIIEEFGYDAKQLGHITRLHFAMTAMYNELTTNNNIDFNINKYVFNLTDEQRELIQEIRRYKYNPEEAKELAEKLIDEMKETKTLMLENRRREIGTLEFNINLWNEMNNWMKYILRENLKQQILMEK